MAKKRIVPEIAQEVNSKIQEQQKKNFTFSFNYFQFDSLKSGIIKEFNNHFKNQEHFLKVNQYMFEAMGILSKENYKSAFIERKLEKIMHCKLLDNEDAVDRIQNILVDGYNMSENVIEQWSDSKYIEFGITNEERFIGILLDYSVIAILYFDPHHLTFPNHRFDIKLKMSYTTPSFLTRESTTAVGLLNGINVEPYNSDYSDTIKDTITIIEEYIDGKVSDIEMYEFFKEIYGGKKDD